MMLLHVCRLLAEGSLHSTPPTWCVFINPLAAAARGDLHLLGAPELVDVAGLDIRGRRPVAGSSK
jgi:hypothetical protein